MDGAVEAGNKVLANVGDVKFFGLNRDRMSRLKSPAAVGANYIIVEGGLDWAVGDEIYLAPTSFQNTHSDYRFISGYDSGTGRVDFIEPLVHYHWGASSSTADDYNGLEMRGEVVLLSRNVRVVGDPYDAWGGHIVTSDTVEVGGVYRAGHMVLDNVEIYNCSQRNTYKSALRFEGAIGRWSSVSNTVVHQGLAWGLYIAASSNILVKDSATIGFKPVGVNIASTSNVTIDGHIAADI